MFTVTGLIIGSIMVVIGVLGVKYTFWVHNQTGPLNFLERYTGSGSTYGIYKIFFTLLMLVGVLWATGFGHNVLEFLLSPLNRVFHPIQ